MGNLGRAGYGASLDGLWPYTYDSCDVGTLPNQTFPDGTPLAATNTGYDQGVLSYAPGQRLSACTCTGEDHPGPIKNDGSFVGDLLLRLIFWKLLWMKKRVLGILVRVPNGLHTIQA